MTREVDNISELENILDVFQNIRDQELSRRQNQQSGNNGGNQGPPRGPINGPAYPRRESNNVLHTARNSRVLKTCWFW